MRLWSFHPKYLDSKGLVALWREGLLAKKVLEGKTKGYKNHPQLDRFKAAKQPIAAINAYLQSAADEAEARSNNFNRSKLKKVAAISRIPVTSGQIKYEWQHLLNKLKRTDKIKLETITNIKNPRLHPLFRRRKEEIEKWEIVS